MSNNNGLDKVHAIHLSRVAVTQEENDLILSEFSEDHIVRVTDCFRACVDYKNEIPKGEQPSLKTFMEGPFSLIVSNEGTSIQNSMMTFELRGEEKAESSGAIITDSYSVKITSASLATIPLLDVFGPKIEKERQRVERLLKQSGGGSPTESNAGRKRCKNSFLYI